MTAAIHWPRLHALHVPSNLDWSLLFVAALVGASICAPLAMFAFAPPIVIGLVALLGAMLGVYAAVLATEESRAHRT